MKGNREKRKSPSDERKTLPIRKPGPGAEHQENAREIHDSEQTSRALLNATADSAVLIDKNGIVLDANDNIAASLGTTRQALVGSLIYDHFSADIAKTRREKEQEAAKSGNLVRFVDYRDKRWMENSIYPVFDRCGRLERFAIFSRNITHEKKTELALRESARYYRTLFESANDAILIVQGTRFVDCNEQALKMFACTRDQIIGKTPAEFSPPLQPDGQATGEKMIRIITDLNAGRPQSFEWKNRRFNGEFFDAEVHLAPMNIKETGRHLAIIRDITRRKEEEEALSKALKEVRRMKEALEAENIYLHKEIQSASLQSDIVGQSKALQSILAQAGQVAKTDSTVLLLGETGTGKELLARAIHGMSSRKDRPLVVVNCAAIPDTLVESELFGREKGAFTGAIARQVGRFEIAHGSTIFLDEIGELGPDIQAKLLRVLQEGEIQRLGSNRTIQVDVRVIAATNRDLAQALSNGTFRKDLFYRLNVFPISIPPLRDHKEDIPQLIWHFIEQLSKRMGKRIEKIPQQSMENLANHHWPGNIRELHNVIERAMIQAADSVLRVPPLSGTKTRIEDTGALVDVEKNHILKVLKETRWRIRGKQGAAEILDLKPTTLESRMRRLGIQRKADISDIS